MPDKISHYLMTCAVKTEAREIIQLSLEDFNDTYTLIFYLVIGICVFTFFLILLLLYFASKNVKGPLSDIKKITLSIAKRALYPDIVKGHTYEKVRDDAKNMESLIGSYVRRFKQIESTEKEYSAFYWGITRPNDQFLFNNWKSKLPPFNVYTDRHMS